MQVVALEAGFHAGQRRKIGDIFDMDESKFRKDAAGKPRLPSWVKAAPNPHEAKREAAAAQQAAAAKLTAGAIAASGGKAAKAKVDAARDLVG